MIYDLCNCLLRLGYRVVCIFCGVVCVCQQVIIMHVDRRVCECVDEWCRVQEVSGGINNWLNMSCAT